MQLFCCLDISRGKREQIFDQKHWKKEQKREEEKKKRKKKNENEIENENVKEKENENENFNDNDNDNVNDDDNDDDAEKDGDRQREMKRDIFSWKQPVSSNLFNTYVKGFVIYEKTMLIINEGISSGRIVFLSYIFNSRISSSSRNSVRNEVFWI